MMGVYKETFIAQCVERMDRINSDDPYDLQEATEYLLSALRAEGGYERLIDSFEGVYERFLAGGEY